MDCGWGAQYLQPGLSSCGPKACGILVPQPGIKPTSSALEGGFLTTGPPGKSPGLILKERLFWKTRQRSYDPHGWYEFGHFPPPRRPLHISAGLHRVSAGSFNSGKGDPTVCSTNKPSLWKKILHGRGIASLFSSVILKISISLSTVSTLVKIQRAGYFKVLGNFSPLMVLSISVQTCWFSILSLQCMGGSWGVFGCSLRTDPMASLRGIPSTEPSVFPSTVKPSSFLFKMPQWQRRTSLERRSFTFLGRITRDNSSLY